MTTDDPTTAAPTKRRRKGRQGTVFGVHAAPGLDANALDLFARIVAAGSFAGAARELGLTRAAVSRRITSLEAALGQPLFARTTRALGLTDAGRRLVVRARAVAEATAAARLGFRAIGKGDGMGADGAEALGGSLRVTAVPTFGSAVLAPLLARFQAAHPGLRLELSFTHRRVDLLREDVDVAFRITARPPEDWVARPVLRFAVRAYAKPRAGLPLAGPEALAAERCLVLGSAGPRLALRWRRDAQDGPAAEGLAVAARASGRATIPDAAEAAPADVEIEPACISDHLETLLGMACAGHGIVFAPDFSVRGEVAAGRLVDALPGWQLRVPEGGAVFALTLPLPASSAAARALVQFVAEALAPGI